MTFPSPILASGFVLAAAALWALRSAAFAANRRSLVKVRGDRRRHGSSKSGN